MNKEMIKRLVTVFVLMTLIVTFILIGNLEAVIMSVIAILLTLDGILLKKELMETNVQEQYNIDSISNTAYQRNIERGGGEDIEDRIDDGPVNTQSQKDEADQWEDQREAMYNAWKRKEENK